MTTFDWILTAVAGLLVVLAFVLLVMTTIPPNDTPYRRHRLQGGALALVALIGLLIVLVVE
ncbi:hypothetical protein [uncultured Arthrobacter sp.]|uniref:hypothetical protein n=1 Tax=uncultured Arthrobacter sp. TaxID=114050 RepID=UPI0026224530|nr:hypothetical protein [uncultured Arthrobacter sp.]